MKLHPLSIPYRVVSRGVGLAWAFLVGGVALAQGDPVLTSGAVVLAVLAIAAVVTYEVAYYRRFEYELTPDSLDIYSGVFSRREREIPLRRVQNVDVTRSFVARLLGLAKVEVETAGGGGTEASLRYVSREEAQRLQEEVRERRAAAQGETGTERTTEEAPGERLAEGLAGEEETGTSRRGETLFELSNRDLALYGALSFDPRLFSSVLAFAPFLVPFVSDRVEITRFGVVLLVAVALVGMAALWLVSALARMVRFYGFELRRVGDDLRYERGLFEVRDGTIPLSKLQTVSVEENVLMRRYGFASLAVETAGYAPGSSPSGGSEAAIPIASREAVFEMANTLEPFHAFDISRPPERARKRYVRRYLLVGVGLLAVGYAISRFLVSFPWSALVPLLVLAVPAAERAHRNRGYDLGPDHVVTQTGFWRRQTRIVPYDRVQTVIRRQTVFQRRWSLTSVVVDTAGSRSIAGSDAAALDRDDAEADEISDRVESQLLAALGSD
ncbi:PH domain-containing protein [Halobacterium wangiae]|uniref:PH domain-containing protein n=1 Tax=Halobacterium wangiae TaxID=2902623 RepID=UPI001E3D2955|nr:PH domain-containing protein [Halobacterium wangiae]